MLSNAQETRGYCKFCACNVQHASPEEECKKKLLFPVVQASLGVAGQI